MKPIKALLVKSFLLIFASIFCFTVWAQEVQNDTIVNDSISSISRTTVSLSFSQNDIIEMPFSKLTSFSLLATGASKFKDDDVYFYGYNTSGKSAYVNGIFIEDASNFPLRAISKMNVFTKDQPITQSLTFGITTTIATLKSNNLIALAEAQSNSSKNMNAGGGELLLSIPLWKAQENKNVPSLLIAGKFSITNNNDPVWKETQKLSDEKMNWLIDNPCQESKYGTVNYNSLYITQNDLAPIKTPENNGSYSYHPLAMLNIPINKNTSLSLGSYASIEQSDIYSQDNYLLNSKNNLQQNTKNFDNFINISQTIIDNSNVNISYNANLQYSNYYHNVTNPQFGDNYFDYGYAGVFTSHMMPTYEIGSDSVDGMYYNNVWLLNSWSYDTLVTFTPTNINPDVSNYASSYFDLFSGSSQGYYQNLDQILIQGGTINGKPLNGGYNGLLDHSARLFNNYGDVNQTIGEASTEKIRVALNFNINFKKHNLTVGGEYNRDKKSWYSINPLKLWHYMRSFTNHQIVELDLDNPILVIHNGFADTIRYNRLYDEDAQTEFDKNLRKALGLPVDGLDYILIDSYNMENNTISYYDNQGVMHTINTPENLLSLDFFSAKEIVADNIASYKGYDYTGNNTNGKDPYSYFTDYSVNADEPQYGSFYIQDEFSYKNLKIKAGLRMEIYDANQPVLKDKYSLFAVNNVKQARELGEIEMDVPDNIGDDYVVYVNKTYGPTKVTGYRNNNNWYNPEGDEIYNTYLLDQGNGITPYIKYPEINSLRDESWQPEMTFTDYKTVVNILPQLSVDYTFLKNYQLYIIYNSFSSNPTSVNSWLPKQYDNHGMFSSGTLTNPGLKPMIGKRMFVGGSALLWDNIIVSAAYLQNRIENTYVVNYVYEAYPNSYNVIENSNDIISIPGMETQVNISENYIKGLSGGISCTKLFHDDKDITANYLSDFVFSANARYRIGSQNPLFNSRIFNGLSINLYYQHRKGKKFEYTEDLQMPTGKYGYTPNVNTCNLNITKEIIIGRKSKLEVYLTIENLFNFETVYDVYSETGQDDSDGFLTDPDYQEYINSSLSPESFRTLYQLNLYNTSFYGMPRIWNFGVIWKY